MNFPKSPRSFVVAKNSRYSFELQSPPEKAEWTLIEILFGGKVEKGSDSATVDQSSLRWITCHYRLDGDFLADLLGSQEFTIEDAKSLAASGVIRMAFSLSQPNAQNGIDSKRGWADIDPEFGCIRQAEIRYRIGELACVLTESGDYKRSREGVPLLTRHVRRQVCTSGNEEYHSQETLEFELEVHDGIPESEFSLGAFGLPEVRGVVWDEPSWHHYWYYAGGIALLVLAVMLAKRLRARVKTPVPISKLEGH